MLHIFDETKEINMTGRKKSAQNKATRVSVVGTGYWGKNLVRTFYQMGNLKKCCDLSPTLLQGIRNQYPGIETTSRFEDVLDDDEIQGVVIVVPAKDHYSLARKALEAGKDIYIEKPMALTVQDAEKLIQLANLHRRILMVGHLLLYHPAVLKMKHLIDSGELGELYYMYGQRVNLGLIRTDENAMWSLAPHDLAILAYLFEEEPESVSARGACYIQRHTGIEDVLFLNIRFANQKMANFQLSWLDPHKIRRTTIVGSKKMVVFDDMEATEKIRIYDKGVETPNYLQKYDSYGDALTLHSGDIHIPEINMVEPLRAECEHFIECIQKRRTPRSDGLNGLMVVKILEAAQRSLEQDGEPVAISPMVEIVSE